VSGAGVAADRDGAERAASSGGASAPPWLAALDRHALALAGLLFLAHLACKLPGAGDRALWLDEAWTVSLATRSVSEVISAARADQNPPLYNLAMRPWLALFGTSELAARSLSVLASAGTAALLFLSARRFFGIEAALYAALLFSASEPQLYYAREARSYALVGLLCVLSFHLFLRQIARPTWATALALGLVNAAAAYTHFTVILAFVAQLAVAIVLTRTRHRAALQYAVGQILALALFAPWLDALRANLPERGRFWLAPPSLEEVLAVTAELAGGAPALAGGLVVLALGAALARRRRQRADPVPLAIVLAWAGVPVVVGWAVSQWTPAFSLRYLLFASLGWFVAVAAAAARLPVAGGGRVALAALVVLPSAANLDLARTRSADWRAAVAIAREVSGERGVVVVAPAWQCLPYSYYLDPASFPDDGARLARLADARVSCITSPAEIDPAHLGWPERIAVVFGKGVPADFGDLFSRLERAGYTRAAARPFPGGNVVALTIDGARGQSPVEPGGALREHGATG
jgi:mannosyltransferase